MEPASEADVDMHLSGGTAFEFSVAWHLQKMSRMKAKSVASRAFTLVASVLFVVLVMRPTVVSGASMMPTLHDKDVLIASPLAARLFQPSRGDIVTVCLSENTLCG